jgi:hypothetical protein
MLLWRHGSVEEHHRKRFKHDLFDNIEMIPECGCWIWMKCTNMGYGVIRPSKYEIKYLHRMMWEKYFGSIPPNMHVLHRCDTPPCCNPHHLFLGSQVDNMKDRDRKGRNPKGEEIGNSKLTEMEILSIRSDSRMQKVIAREYKISPSHVSQIKSRKRWKHIPERTS